MVGLSPTSLEISNTCATISKGVKLRLKPEWNHYSRHFPHFDLITQKMIDKAILLGARVDENSVELFDRTRQVFKKFFNENAHLKYWYHCKGLLKQPIMRIDFKKLGFPKKKQLH